MAEHFTIPLEVAIRHAERRHLSQLEWFGVFHLQRQLIHREWERYCRGEAMMLVAECNDWAIGQAWIDPERKGEESVGVIWAVRVVPYFRRLGIGTRLIAAAEHEVAAAGLDCAELGVERTNPDARRLYERLGYHLVAEEIEEFTYPDFDGNPVHDTVDLWVLRKRVGHPADHAPAPKPLHRHHRDGALA